MKDWCYQRYIWQSELDPTKSKEEKVVKTLIYGVAIKQSVVFEKLQHCQKRSIQKLKISFNGHLRYLSAEILPNPKFLSPKF